VSQGHASLVELLVEAGADVTAADEDGDTGIHVACLKLHSLQGEASRTLSPNIFNVSYFVFFCFYLSSLRIIVQLSFLIKDPAVVTFERSKSKSHPSACNRLLFGATWM
jgi:hypothetical protein